MNDKAKARARFAIVATRTAAAAIMVAYITGYVQSVSLLQTAEAITAVITTMRVVLIAMIAILLLGQAAGLGRLPKSDKQRFSRKAFGVVLGATELAVYAMLGWQAVLTVAICGAVMSFSLPEKEEA